MITIESDIPNSAHDRIAHANIMIPSSPTSYERIELLLEQKFLSPGPAEEVEMDSSSTVQCRSQEYIASTFVADMRIDVAGYCSSFSFPKT